MHFCNQCNFSLNQGETHTCRDCTQLLKVLPYRKLDVIGVWSTLFEQYLYRFGE